jgi:hypothetical protein
VEPGPVFVAGPERSGTSLLYALLASHSQLAMTRRTNLWKHFYLQYGDLSDPANLDRCLETMSRYKRLRVLHVDFRAMRRDFVAGPPSYPRLFALLEEQYAARLGRPRWGDKSLHTECWTEPILASYPGARILHMVRDPRDRYASSHTRWKRRGGIGAGMAEWQCSARLAAENAARFPSRYLVVRYEDLVADPEATVRAICHFVDAPFELAMLAMGGAPRLLDQGSNSSYGRREAGVIATDSIGRYRSVLSEREIAFAQQRACDEMQEFGYGFDDVPMGQWERARYNLTTLPLERIRGGIWTTVEARRMRRGRPVPDHRLVEAEAPR